MKCLSQRPWGRITWSSHIWPSIQCHRRHSLYFSCALVLSRTHTCAHTHTRAQTHARARTVIAMVCWASARADSEHDGHVILLWAHSQTTAGICYLKQSSLINSESVFDVDHHAFFVCDILPQHFIHTPLLFTYYNLIFIGYLWHLDVLMYKHMQQTLNLIPTLSTCCQLILLSICIITLQQIKCNQLIFCILKFNLKTEGNFERA